MAPARTFLLLVLAAAAATAALASASLISANHEMRQTVASPPATGLFAGIPQEGLALGNPNAPVTLVEYADLQCPYCGAWAKQTLPVLVNSYVRRGQVLLVWRGLGFVGPDSVSALTAVDGAARQDHLWELVHELYRRQGAENTGWFTPVVLDEAVSAVPGLHAGRLARDRPSAWTAEQIQAAAAEADAVGVRGTPSFEIGRTGGPLRLVSLTSIGPEGLRPAIEDLLER